MKTRSQSAIFKLSTYIFLSLILLFSGCKTTKQAAKSNITNSTRVEMDAKAEKTENTTETSKERIAHRSETETEKTKNTKQTVFSEPDSLGNQYVKSITETTETTNKKQQLGTNSKKGINKNTEKIEKNRDNSNLILSNNAQTDNKVQTEVNTPTGINIGVILFSVGVIAILILVLKRFGLIKW